MSRRPPNPSADRAAQNQQTLKTLVKLESNKSCADCKKNKHPRWASWNLGIFVCIRCSGIHRGMGTHISRVKSVDLDAWTDEQLQSMLRWGNARANKYWEAKLAPGHVPAESKIENFIRTKYDSRRWVMEGGIPDPALLNTEGDDEVPLNVVQEKAKLDRSFSTRATSAQVSVANSTSGPMLDLFGDVPTTGNAPSTITTLTTAVPAPAKSLTSQKLQQGTAPPKAARPGESLLGFDFFGSAASDAPSRPASAAASSNPTSNSRPDLKQSILSLYASAARSPGPNQHARAASSNPSSLFDAPPTTESSKGLDDAFGDLNFKNTPSSVVASAPKTSSAMGSLASPTSSPAINGANGFSPKPASVGGSFFDTKPVVSAPAPGNTTTPRPGPVTRASDFSQGFGDFTSTKAPATLHASSSKPTSNIHDMFDFSTPTSSTTATGQKPVEPDFASDRSPFNLTAARPQPQPGPQTPSTPSSTKHAAGLVANLDNSDPWGSSNAWAPSQVPPPSKFPTRLGSDVSPAPNEWNTTTNKKSLHSVDAARTAQITADEDFGGWESGMATTATTGSTSVAPAKSSGGFAGGEDLFSNVWE